MSGVGRSGGLSISYPRPPDALTTCDINPKDGWAGVDASLRGPVDPPTARPGHSLNWASDVRHPAADSGLKEMAAGGRGLDCR